MSGRAPRRRGRPPKQDTPKFQFNLLKKPKYLLNRDGEDNSRSSTPNRSRGASPSRETPRPKSTRKKRSTPKVTLSRRGGKSATPSRYSYSIAAERASDYHYGSDFDEDSDRSEPEPVPSESELDEPIEISEDQSDSLSVQSSDIAKNKPFYPRPPTPEPLWLQDLNLPALDTPKSSDDLLLPVKHVMQATGVYEVLRHYRILVRLSPFRLEDFCAALVQDELTILLSEIHVMLLKAIFREEDSQNTHFGPLDQKDSINSCLFFIDPMTWPEVLRAYVESDKSFDHDVLSILAAGDYPYVDCEKRLKVLQFLTDQFLTTNPVREDVIYEGPFHYDDHCRICHRLGDLLCCETCPAVYHLNCVDPPLTEVPEEDWQCAVCKSHFTAGVSDCVVDSEKAGLLCRQDPLGYDRHGRKYWFLSRRIFIEGENETYYYSTATQLEELLHSLDAKYMERDLCRAIDFNKETILQHMAITEKLTKDAKGSRKSYLELNDAELKKVQEERREREKEEEEKRKANRDSEYEELEARLEQEQEAANKLSQMLSGVSEDTAPNDIETEEVSLDFEEGQVPMEMADVHCEVVTSDEQTVPPATTESSKSAKTEKSTESVISKTVSTPQAESKVPNTRLRSQLVAAGTHLFKLGQDKECKTYVNQYTQNLYALNKPQRNEERDKKRHLSHKFSLTQASEFKWNGAVYGLRNMLCTTLKHSIIQLEAHIPHPFMHINWPAMRKTWLGLVQGSNTADDFARVLAVLQVCVRPVVFASVWHEQLGHIRLQRITALDREERKKIEKREKKEKEDEEERNRLTLHFIKYTLGLKHSVQKQKGEEYRIHGQWGWQWLSNIRRLIIQDATKMGLRGKPDKYMVEVFDGTQRRLLAVDPGTYEFLMKKQERDKEAARLLEAGLEPATPPPELTENDKRFKNLRITPPITSFDTIDVSDVLLTPARLYYPKVAKKSKLDDLLPRRIKLKALEERKLLEMGVEPVKEEPVEFKNLSPQVAELARQAVATNQRYREAAVICKNKCYCRSCPEGCYSPLCSLRLQLKKEVSQLIRNLQTHVSQQNIQSVIHSAEKAMNETKANAHKAVKKEEHSSMIPNEEIKSEPVEEMRESVPESMLEEEVVSMDEMTCREQDEAFSHVKKEDDDVNVVDDGPQTPANGSILSSILSPKKEVKDTKLEPNTVRLKNGETAQRVYSVVSPAGVIKLAKLVTAAELKKKPPIKFPRCSRFRRRKSEYSMMVLARAELRKLARRGGRHSVQGFHHLAKSNNQAWPYPNSRPLFKTCWQYRTVTIPSIANIALQLRIMWACFRWDDMNAKPQSLDGKTQITSETEIITLEILKHRHLGEHLERTQYLRRKVVIPLELPKAERSVSPIRSGLRKRKREEVPQSTDPQVSKEWVDEDKLELWEIKQYAEKLERINSVAVTRTRTGAIIPKVEKEVKVENNVIKAEHVISKGTPEEIKEKMEIQLRAQRAAHQQKKQEKIEGPFVKTSTGQLVKLLPGQQVTADGCFKVIPRAQLQANIKSQLSSLLAANSAKANAGGVSGAVTPGNTSTTPQTAKSQIIGTRKIVMSREGVVSTVTTPTIIKKAPVSQANMIKLQPAAPQVQAIQPVTSQPTKLTTIGGQNAQSRFQLLQIGSDGKMQLRNVAGGQQLVQMADGKSYLVRTQSTSGVLTPCTVASPATPTPATTASQPSPTHIILKNSQGQNVRVLGSGGQPAKNAIQPGVKSIIVNKEGGKIVLTTAPQTAAGAAVQPSPTLQPAAQPTAQAATAATVIVNNAPTLQPNSIVMRGNQVIGTTNERGQVVWNAGVTNKPNLQCAPASPTVQKPTLIASQGGATPILSSAGVKQIVKSVSGQTVTSNAQIFTQTGQIVSSPSQAATPQTAIVPTQVISGNAATPRSMAEAKSAGNIVVNNALAQQLGGGKLVLACINGQQVLVRATPAITPQNQQLRLTASSGGGTVLTSTALQTAVAPLTPTKPAVVQSAHAQTFPKAQQSVIQSTNKVDALQAAQTPQRIPIQIKQQVVKSVAPTSGTILQSRLQSGGRVIENKPAPEAATLNHPESPSDVPSSPLTAATVMVDQNTEVERQLLAGQPPGTIIKSVTAQMVQTAEGPRILLQGIQGAGFTQQQIALVQQQVKQQVMKNVAAGKPAAMGPTKIYLAVQPPPLSSPEKDSQESDNGSAPRSGQPVNNSGFVKELLDKTKIGATMEDVEALLNSHETPVDFEITPDYIQQTIKQALKQENLNPEIEEKLIQLQKYQERQMKGETPNHSSQPRPAAVPAAMSPSVSPVQKPTPARKRPNAPLVNAMEVEVVRPKKVAKFEPKADIRPSPKPDIVDEKSPSKSRVKWRDAQEEKKRQQVATKLSVLLFRHKELLKKEILKKRALLERDLQLEIQREVTAELTAESVRSGRGRRTTVSATPTGRQPGRPKKSPRSNSPTSPSFRKKLLCKCRTPYDDTKFYVGCDLCHNWFHGDCVGISQAMSHKINEFICEECRHARDSQELYCLCRQPYDETQFYICCDKCQDWFHGRCVGILQSEADSIDEYVCPNCEVNTTINYANMKSLNTRDYEALKKLIKQLEGHKSAWPFMEPVDPTEAPNYYEVIKDPIDLQTIEGKINEHQYKNLSEFIGDMTRLFDNCRYYNPKESPFFRCAEGLESYFVQKVKFIREKILENQ